MVSVVLVELRFRLRFLFARWLRSRARVAAFPFALPIPAARCPSPRPVALVRQTPLPGLLALCRVGDAVVMVRVIGPTPARLDGLPRRLSRDQAVAARADEILPPGLDE